MNSGIVKTYKYLYSGFIKKSKSQIIFLIFITASAESLKNLHKNENSTAVQFFFPFLIIPLKVDITALEIY